MKRAFLISLLIAAVSTGLSAGVVTHGYADCKQYTATNNRHALAGRAYKQDSSWGCNEITTFYASGSEERMGVYGFARTTLNTTDNGATYHIGECQVADTDVDGDGYNSNVDCNDGNATIHPGAMEICGDGIDQDCSGEDLACSGTDHDGDGYNSDSDCNDGNAAIHPGAPEICGDGIDQDCSGADLACGGTDHDGDGYASGEDCDDNNPNVYPGAFDFCGDGIDQNCDGKDTTCVGAPSCISNLSDWKLKYTPANANCTSCHTTCTPGGASGIHGCPEGGAWMSANCTGCHRSVH